LPNDVLLASPSVSPAVIEAVKKTFAEKGDVLLAAITATEENEKYIGGSFTATVTDKDYDSVRKMFETVGVTEFSQFLGE
jgi:phosphonate transport system substrate-binding protein